MSHSATTLHRLPDGRILEYATFGDPNGIPLLYFHGFLGSCHQAALADSAARQAGFRVIAPNRPGIGQSTLHRFLSMRDYAEDIRHLLDTLNIYQAVMVGMSSGGCFALACTQALPDRVRLTSVAGCIGPLNIMRNLQTMHWFRRWFLVGCNDHPVLVGGLLRSVYIVCKYRPQWLYRWLVQTSCLIEPGLNAVKQNVETMLWNDYRDVFLRRSGVHGLREEARLFFRWGFTADQIPAHKRVLFWHGKSDPLFPWSAARNLARSIKSAEIVLCSGGHMTFLTKIEEMLERIRLTLQTDESDDFSELEEKNSKQPVSFLLPTFS